MAGIGDFLLGLGGHSDPKAQLIKAILSSAGGTGQGQPGGGTGAPPATVATPAGLPGAGPAPAPGQGAAPPRSPVYDSPPDLLSLYSELSDYQSRQKRVDTGLGLLGGAIVQPQNREFVQKMFDTGEQSDPLALTLKLNEYQQAQREAEAKRLQDEQSRNRVPAIAKQYGIDPDTAMMLYESGELDAFVLEANKPDNKIVEDNETGHQMLIAKDGTVIKDLGGGLKPTNDQQEFDRAKKNGEIPADMTWTQYQEWAANLKKPVTNITNNIDTTGNKLIEGFDDIVKAQVEGTQASADAITQLQGARNTLTKGVVAGSVIAPATNEGRKIIAQIFGFDDATASNTDTLMAQLKNVVLPKLKELRPVSDTDLSVVEGIVGGTTTLTPQTINQLIDIQEKAARAQIDKARKKAQKRVDAETNPDQKARMQASLDAAMPDVPDYDAAFLSHIDPEDLQALKDGKVKPSEFDDLYGPGVAEQLLRGN